MIRNCQRYKKYDPETCYEHTGIKDQYKKLDRLLIFRQNRLNTRHHTFQTTQEFLEMKKVQTKKKQGALSPYPALHPCKGNPPPHPPLSISEAHEMAWA